MNIITYILIKLIKIYKFLISYGARDDLVNVNNETPRYLNMQYNLLSNDNEFEQQQPNYQLSNLQRMSQEMQQPEDQVPGRHAQVWDNYVHGDAQQFGAI